MIILASILFTFYVVTLARIPDRIKWLKRKPFTCTICLAVWVAVGLYFAPPWLTEFIAIVFGAGNGIALYDRIMNKLF